MYRARGVIKWIRMWNNVMVMGECSILQDRPPCMADNYNQAYCWYVGKFCPVTFVDSSQIVMACCQGALCPHVINVVLIQFLLSFPWQSNLGMIVMPMKRMVLIEHYLKYMAFGQSQHNWEPISTSNLISYWLLRSGLTIRLGNHPKLVETKWGN